jgi:signal transduction histidine kinase
VTLSTRLLVFFLATLALVLVGFSITLYFLARMQLTHQARERLEAAFNTLSAVAEVSAEGVEWDPAGRPLRLGTAAFGEPVPWLVGDDHGRVVDRSQQPGCDDFFAQASQALESKELVIETWLRPGRGRWLWDRRWLGPTTPPGPKSAVPQITAKGDGRKYAALSISVGVSVEPMWAALNRLAMTLGALSLGIWLAALFVGRLVCRRALAPVTQLAAAVREMPVEDLGNRLPAPHTGDELEALSTAFNSLMDRLQESFERQRRFTGDASHQLRTPLTAMLGQVEVALRRDRPADEYRRVLDAVQDQAGHLQRVVEALLFLARADAEARLPQAERLCLADWLPRHLQNWSEHPRARDLVLQCEPGSLEVESQPLLLGELLNILLDNACKFSQPGTPITVRACPEKQIVLIEVQDQGCGIAEEDLPHIFAPFFRCAQRGVEGTGLGLAIAKRLAEACGGALTAASQVGQGSCFSLTLPAAESAVILSS